MRDGSDDRRSSRVSLARLAAYDVLRIVERRDAFAQDIIAKQIDEGKLSAQDKAFATKLVLGVVSTKGSLDLILDRCLRSSKDIKPNVRCALRISTYEIIYLDKQTHAAVDQGVELVGYIAPKARGLANSVLRKIAAAKASFPFGDIDRSIDALALKEGFPAWMASFLVSTFGRQKAASFMASANEPAPVYVAVNSLKMDEAAFCADAEAANVAIRPAFVNGFKVAGCFELVDRKAAADRFILDAIDRGSICISDAAAQMVANITARSAVLSFASARPGIGPRELSQDMSMLELCAGRATKTILLQSDLHRIIGDQLQHLIALDNVDFKVGLLRDRIEDYGVHVEEAICADATDLPSVFPKRTFDCVFLDSPCTGLGTLRRHPEIRWRCTPDSIANASKLDAKLLASAASVVSLGGILVYATCTITPDENQRSVAAFLKSDIGRSFRLVPLDAVLDISRDPQDASDADASRTDAAADASHAGGDPHGSQCAQEPMACFQSFTTSGGPDSHFCCVLKRVSDR